jgi:hypothetical protein
LISSDLFHSTKLLAYYCAYRFDFQCHSQLSLGEQKNLALILLTCWLFFFFFSTIILSHISNANASERVDQGESLIGGLTVDAPDTSKKQLHC